MPIPGGSELAGRVRACVTGLALLALAATAPPASGGAPGQEESGPSVPRRVVLAELFTGSECRPCTAADLAFDRILEEYSRETVVMLVYHVDIPTRDPMSISDNFHRMDYYAGGISYRNAPQAYFGGDRVQRGQGGPRGRTSNYFNRAQRLIEASAGEPAGAEIEGRTYLGFEGGEIEIEIEPIVDSDDELRFHLVLYEDRIQYTGANQVSEHRYVVRDFVTDVEGRELEPSPEGWRIVENVSREQALLGNSGLVAFVQERGSRRVLQARRFEFGADLPDAAALHNEAVELARAGDLARALPLFRNAVEVDPGSATGHCSLGLALAGRGDLRGAILSWERCVELDPSRFEVHLRLSYAYEDLGENDSAIDHIRTFLDVAPNHPRAERERERLEGLRGGEQGADRPAATGPGVGGLPSATVPTRPRGPSG